MNYLVFAIIAIVVLAYFLQSSYLKGKEMKRQLQLLKGLINNIHEDSTWSSLSILDSMSYRTINDLSQEIRSYYRQHMKIWSATEIGEYIDSLEKSGMSAVKIELLCRWLREGIAFMGAARTAEIFIKLTSDSLRNFDNSEHNYLMKTRSYITKSVVGRQDFNEFIKYLMQTSETHDNGYPDEAKILLKSEIIKLKHLATLRK